MTVHIARLDAVCEINPRMPKGLADDAAVSFLPMAAVSEDGRIDFEEQREAGEVKKGYTYFERGDVLVAKITPCFENGKATRTEALANPAGFGSTEFHVLRAGREIDSSYLFYLIWNSKFREVGANNMTGSAGQKRVPADFLKRLEIPLPPLDEQRRIAAILDKADDLRRKRKRAIELLDSLTQSIFLQLANSDSQKLSIVDFARIQGGKRLPKGHDYCEEETGYKYLRVTDLQDQDLHRIQLKNLRKETFQSIKRYIVDEDDVVITIAGTIGVTRHIDAELAGVNLTENAAKIVIFDRDRVDPVYLSWALQSEAVQSQIRASTGQVTIGKLALFRIEQLEIDVPKLEKQRHFRRILEEQRKNRRIAALAFTNIDLLFTSLQSRAFSGQL